jgi:hypothetical protein
MRRTFNADIQIYSVTGTPVARATCLLYVDVVPFTRSAWGGTITKLDPESAKLEIGPYLVRLSGGNVSRIEVSVDAPGGWSFVGEGSIAI